MMVKFVEYVVMGLGIGIGLILASGVAAILAGLLGHSLPHIGVG